VKVFRAKLPVLLKRLSKIKDPRNPKKIKHQHTVLMIYGILTFIFHMSSRRQANREMTRPMFMENLKLLFPELEDLPHNDTLMRFLARIDVGEIESALMNLAPTCRGTFSTGPPWPPARSLRLATYLE